MHFPDEIILLIGEAAHPCERPSLLRVCRRWHSVLERLVYSELDLSPRQIIPLASAIHRRPELALFVRSLSLRLGEVRFLSSSETQLPTIKWFQRQIVKLNTPSLSWGISEHDSDVWAAFLLLLMENLVDIHIEHPEGRSIFILMHAVAHREKPFDARPALTHLRSATVHITGQEPAYSEPSLLACIEQPTLRSVFFNGWFFGSLFSRYSPLDRPPPSPSGVEEIEIEGIWEETEGMGVFIAIPATLKTFRFTNTLSTKGYIPKDAFLREEFYIPLLKRKDDLEVLELNYRGTAHEDMYDCEDGQGLPPGSDTQPQNRWLGSFAEFACLRELSIRAPNILDLGQSLSDNITSSLHLLRISYISDAQLDITLDNISQLLNAKDRFPTLNTITIAKQTSTDLISYKHRQRERILRLKEEAAAIGVEFMSIALKVPRREIAPENYFDPDFDEDDYIVDDYVGYGDALPPLTANHAHHGSIPAHMQSYDEFDYDPMIELDI